VQITGVLLGEMLEAERDEHLGYTRDDGRIKETDNARNGYSQKTVFFNQGKLELQIPRDRYTPLSRQRGILHKHWNQILAQLSIHFQERVAEYL